MFRLNLFRLSNKDVFVIPHLYGELAQHRMGIKLIQDKVKYLISSRLSFSSGFLGVWDFANMMFCS